MNEQERLYFIISHEEYSIYGPYATEEERDEAIAQEAKEMDDNLPWVELVLLAINPDGKAHVQERSLEDYLND